MIAVFIANPGVDSTPTPIKNGPFFFLVAFRGILGVSASDTSPKNHVKPTQIAYKNAQKPSQNGRIWGGLPKNAAGLHLCRFAAAMPRAPKMRPKWRQSGTNGDTFRGVPLGFGERAVSPLGIAGKHATPCIFALLYCAAASSLPRWCFPREDERSMKFHATRRAAFAAVALAVVGLFAAGGCERAPENLAHQIGPVILHQLYVCLMARGKSDTITL